MFRIVGLMFILLAGVGLVVFGNEATDRFANVAGHVLVLFALLVGVKVTLEPRKETLDPPGEPVPLGVAKKSKKDLQGLGK